ncbi:putative ubiquitin fusion degradation protein [Dactylonectria estremocensis]|uniref:Ubiquitin fusion degradation protein n=1 Tax=Dactylonectria estremocensis TaxID=1079267 RepID=A0A9P9JAW4_9HYPO|nr:putative ubiquitin fusion degradation protein [Dactylonectria estremocensis]
MNQAIVDDHTRVEIQPPILNLFDALCNSLVLRNTIPYLPVSSLLSLAASSRSLRALLYETPGVFRHLDLTHVKTAQPETTKDVDNDLVWHNVQLVDYLTEDDFYSGPLRGVFSTLRQRDLLRDVQTLILDGLSVTAEMCHEIINDANYSVRLLSIRDVKHMNQGKLRAALTYACRSTRPEGMPRLKGIYCLGSKDTPKLLPAPAVAEEQDPSISAGWNQKSQTALTASLRGEGDAWWFKKGRMATGPMEPDWANCLQACQGLIAFDAMLCQGPRHRNSPVYGQAVHPSGCGPAMATFAVGGCASCGKAPEGLMDPATSRPSNLPLLAPPPILSSSIRAATMPGPGAEAFTPRCGDCLTERFCVCCNKWWCESCYYLPGQGLQESVIIVDHEMSNNGWDNAGISMDVEWTAAKSKVRKGLCEPCTTADGSSTRRASSSR